MWMKDGKPFSGTSVIVGNRRIFNPSDATMLASGYHWEEPPAPEPPDMTDFNAACAKFREVCAEIGELIGVADFKGGFDEMAEFQASEAAHSEAGIALAVQWIAANELCKYEGGKVGLGQPEWWYKCWEE